MQVKEWMSWEAGVDVAGVTDAALPMPNVIVNVARIVHTPIGSTPAGIVLIQPDPNAPPTVFGFVCGDETIGRYFGPKIFAGTPFENAPVLKGSIEIVAGSGGASSIVRVAGVTIETRLTKLGAAELIHRAPGPMPFAQQGIEQAAGSAVVSVDGKPLTLIIPPIGLTGGPSAVYAPCGVYAR